MRMIKGVSLNGETAMRLRLPELIRAHTCTVNDHTAQQISLIRSLTSHPIEFIPLSLPPLFCWLRWDRN